MTEKIRSKNRILNSNAVIVGIILCVGLGVVVTHADSLDKVVLLEDRNPGYWEYLRPEFENTYYYHGSSNNLLISQMQSGEDSRSFTIKVNQDQSISISGRNDDTDVWLVISNQYLQEGNFTLFDRNASDSNSYFYAYSKDGGQGASLPTQPELIVPSYSQCEIGFFIRKGMTVNKTFYPSILSEGEIVKFGSYSTLYGDHDKYSVINVDSNNINSSDLDIWKNAHSNNGFSWSSIFLNDGTGIQLKSGMITRGRIDKYGIIEK